jgi:hypothetical protein
MNPPSVPGTTYSVPSLSSHGSAVLQPGYYPGGITLGSHQELTLSPGIYYVENGIDLGAQTTVNGSGVTIYIRSGGVNMSVGRSES